MTATILLTSTGRPTMESAIESVLSQTSDAYELVIMDSGDGEYSWTHYEKYYMHPKVRWNWTLEPEGMRYAVCPVTWVFNRAYQLGLIKGDYFCCHYDDDLYYPEFIEKMSGYLDSNPEVKAVRCSQRRSVTYVDGRYAIEGTLVADKRMYPTDNYDCQVDGMQVMFRISILEDLNVCYNGQIMPEATDTCSHSDGVFFNRARVFIPEMHYIPDILCEHRSTVHGVYTSQAPFL